MNNNPLQLILIVSCVILSACAPHQKIESRQEIKYQGSKQRSPYFLLPRITTQTDHPQPHVITIWVHGTRLSPTAYIPLFNSYEKMGLLKKAGVSKKYNLRKRLDALEIHGKHRFGNDNIYSFRWNGQLSFTERRKAGKDLLRQLKELKVDYEQKHNVTPTIKVITHSHGGNVLLNCARAEKKLQTGIVFDEVVLLACPVQQATTDYINDPMFKKIYALFSSVDSIQVLDPQGLFGEKTGESFPFFSQRKFPEHQKVRNIQIRYQHRGIGHIDFVLEPFIKKLAHILNFVDEFERKNSSFFDSNYLKVKID